MSIVEWCEARVDRNNYIFSEYWNSISNIAFLLSMSSHHPPHVNMSITMVGIGSFIFHATETRIGQLFDELSMSILAYTYCIQVCPNAFPYSMYSCVFICVWILYIHYQIYYMFVVFFLCQIMIPVYIICFQVTKTEHQKKCLFKAILCVVASVAFWIWERRLHYHNQCPTELLDPRYYLHSYWHIGMAMAHHNFMNSI